LHDHLHFESAYSRFYPGIRRHLARLVGETAADDLAQEVFVKALGSMSGLRNAESLRPWLYRVATNTGLDCLRRSARSPVTHAPLEEGHEIEGRGVLPGSSLRTVESDAIRDEMGACVRAVVERLPVSQRIALTLSEIEGQSDAEIAALLGVSVGCVKIRLHRARARLRKELAGSCRLFRDARNEIVCEPMAPAGTAHRRASLGPYPFVPPDRLGKRKEAAQCQNNVVTWEAELR
jgi:RNA polymerase sigma-70 factor (ECF subfamily)